MREGSCSCSVRNVKIGTQSRWTGQLLCIKLANIHMRRHLIADHIGWFKETEGTDGGKLRTIEDLMRQKGEKVTRGRIDAGGVIEYTQ